MNINNNNNDNNDNRITRDQGQYEYKSPEYNNRDDGKYVYKDDYGNEKSIALKILPVLLLLIVGLILFMVFGKGLSNVFENNKKVLETNGETETVKEISNNVSKIRDEGVKNLASGEWVVYTGKDNSSIVAPSNWKQITDESHIAKFYKKGDEENLSLVMLALESNYGRFLLERYSGENYDKRANSLLDNMKEKAGKDGLKSAMDYLVENGYTPMELEFIEKYLSGSEITQEEFDRFKIEYVMQDWFYEIRESGSNVDILESNELLVNGKVVPIYNTLERGETENDKDLRVLEGYYVFGDEIVRFNTFGWDGDYSPHANEILSMIESFKLEN